MMYVQELIGVPISQPGKRLMLLTSTVAFKGTQLAMCSVFIINAETADDTSQGCSHQSEFVDLSLQGVDFT